MNDKPLPSNANELEPNAYGEVRMHVSIRDLPDGFYVLNLSLVDNHGNDLPYSDSANFFVDSTGLESPVCTHACSDSSS